MSEPLLSADYINSLPQPLFLISTRKDSWLVHDFDVETGLFRIDVCGHLETRHIGEALAFRDSDGTAHAAESFYADALIAKLEGKP